MKNFIKLIAITLVTVTFSMAIAFSPQSVLANTNNSSSANSAQQAAQKVVEETGVKEQFGQSKNGEKLLDDASENAGRKLNDLAEKAESRENLPNSEKLFLKNLQSK